MDTEGDVTFGVQDELDEVALCGISIVDGCHDDRELDFAALHEEKQTKIF